MRPLRHALFVGGTGMLAGATRAFLKRGIKVTSVARHASGFDAGGDANYLPLDLDYSDPRALRAALVRHSDTHGFYDLAVAWVHNTAPDAPRIVASVLGGPGPAARLFHVLGSAVADPARPDRLDKWRTVTNGFPNCLYRAVVLGFVVEGGCSRWLTDDEISAGVVRAVDDDAELSTVGTTTPWSARP